jgi:hypothetical protein
MEPGLLNNWFWDGNIKYPVSPMYNLKLTLLKVILNLFCIEGVALAREEDNVQD